MIRPVHRLFRHLRTALLQRIGRRPAPPGLTAVEYEAVCLIAFEGREAYAHALEQAAYCRSMGSPSGTIFWTEVAAEIARRTGRTRPGQTQRLSR
jgi:hypothetical protein